MSATMDPHRHPIVVPSNAPSQYDVGGVDPSSPRGILQERCQNRQDEYLDGGQLGQQFKAEPSAYTENHYRSVGHRYHGHPRQRYYVDDEARKNREADRLVRRLMSCPGYRKYRSKIPKGSTNDADQKWPEHLERAFCRALVEHPPMGRKKLTMDHKLRGRNELIADYIQKVTGEPRCRKQVSSHIQVVKPMVKDDPEIMRYLTTEDEMDHRRHRHRASAALARRNTLVTAVRNQHFHHPQPSSIASQISESFFPSAMNTDPTYERPANELFQPQVFSMYVADVQREPQNPFHIFTSMGQSPRLQDIQLQADDHVHWRSQFPRFADMIQSGTLTGQVLLCEAKIALLPQDIPPNAELRIHFEVGTPAYVAGGASLQCRTSFFENGNPLDTTDRSITIDTETSRCQLSFGSGFWAGRTVAWQKTLRDAAPQRRSQAEEEVRHALKGLTAVQEVYYGKEPTGRQRLLMICWRFDQAKDRRGETTWRNVVPVQQHERKDFVKSEPAANHAYEHTSGDFPPADPETSKFFDHGNFDLGALASVSLNGLPPELDTVPDEMYSANGLDFHGGNIQICLDTSVPIEAYTDPTQGYQQYQQEPRSAVSAVSAVSDWAAPYPNIFDQGAYGSHSFEQPAEHGAEEGMAVGQQEFSMSPLSHMHADNRGVLSSL